jgi:hypothetical protein
VSSGPPKLRHSRNAFKSCELPTSPKSMGVHWLINEIYLCACTYMECGVKTLKRQQHALSAQIPHKLFFMDKLDLVFVGTHVDIANIVSFHTAKSHGHSCLGNLLRYVHAPTINVESIN